jgi:hypothetical protein
MVGGRVVSGLMEPGPGGDDGTDDERTQEYHAVDKSFKFRGVTNEGPLSSPGTSLGPF